MKACVLDSSVIIKWFRKREEETEKALFFRTSFLQGKLRLYVPTLLLYEIGNVLCYKRDLTIEEAEAAPISLIDIGIEIVRPDEKLLSSAMKLAFEHKISFYDAHFLALAKHFKCPLVTADEKLARVPIEPIKPYLLSEAPTF